MFEYISKDEAKKRIDESPGDFIIWSDLIHLSERIEKMRGRYL